MGCSSSKAQSVADESAAQAMRQRRGGRASIVSSNYKVETVKDAGAAEAQRLVASAGSLPLQLPAAGLSLRYAFLSQRGYYPDAPDKANQDAVGATEALGGSAGARAVGVGGAPVALGGSAPRLCNLNRQPPTRHAAAAPLHAAETHLFGVFDGHGECGTECAQFVKDKVRRRVVNGSHGCACVGTWHTLPV